MSDFLYNSTLVWERSDSCIKLCTICLETCWYKISHSHRVIDFFVSVHNSIRISKRWLASHVLQATTSSSSILLGEDIFWINLQVYLIGYDTNLFSWKILFGHNFSLSNLLSNAGNLIIYSKWFFSASKVALCVDYWWLIKMSVDEIRSHHLILKWWNYVTACINISLNFKWSCSFTFYYLSRAPAHFSSNPNQFLRITTFWKQNLQTSLFMKQS